MGKLKVKEMTVSDLQRNDRIVAEVIISAMVDDLKSVFQAYGGEGAAGKYLSEKASSLLGYKVQMPLVNAGSYNTGQLMKMMFDPTLQKGIDKFQTELSLLPLPKQMQVMEQYSKINWRALRSIDNNQSKRGWDSLMEFVNRFPQELAVKFLGLNDLKFMLQHLPYLQEVLELTKVYANLAVEANRLFEEEKEWLVKDSGLDNARITERLTQINTDFAAYEQTRVKSISELVVLVPNLRELISMANLEAGNTDRSAAMAHRVSVAELLEKTLQKNYEASLAAQEKLAEEMHLEHRLIKTYATQAAHIQRAVFLSILGTRSTSAFETILTMVHLSIQNTSTAIIATIQFKMDKRNNEALITLKEIGLNNYNRMMQNVHDLTVADIQYYLPILEKETLSE